MEQRRAAHRSRAQWQGLFEEQRSSGLCQSEFCRSRGILVSTFRNARRRHGVDDTALELSPTFVPVDVLEAHSPGARWDVELALGDGVVLRVRRG